MNRAEYKQLDRKRRELLRSYTEAMDQASLFSESPWPEKAQPWLLDAAKTRSEIEILGFPCEAAVR